MQYIHLANLLTFEWEAGKWYGSDISFMVEVIVLANTRDKNT